LAQCFPLVAAKLKVIAPHAMPALDCDVFHVCLLRRLR
jgi:hypothetical protein